MRRIFTFTLGGLIAVSAMGQTTGYVDLHNFGGTLSSGPDGITPYSVTFDSAGNMYGVTAYGGPYDPSRVDGGGNLWEITKAGVYIDLHDFVAPNEQGPSGQSGPDGYSPESSLTIDAKGDIFGTTRGGGANSGGIAWEYSASGVYSHLHDFGGTTVNANGQLGDDGDGPYGGVAFDSAGNLYGTTCFGGLYSVGGGGTIWEITKAGVYKDLHDFGGTVARANGLTGPDGQQPIGNVTFDAAGNLFGTASQSGSIEGGGIIWELTKSGSYLDAHDFGGKITNSSGADEPDGIGPVGGITIDSSGNKLGTAKTGGYYGLGIVWEIAATGVYKDLHDFGAPLTNPSGYDGQNPIGQVAIDAQGNVFGATQYGGANFGGIVWEIDKLNGGYFNIHDFGITEDDSQPMGGVVVDASGSIYGTSSMGGADLGGTVWKLSGAAQLYSSTLTTSVVLGGASELATVRLTLPAPAGGATVSLSSSSPSATVPSTVVVPAGQETATFTVSSTAVSTDTPAIITARYGSVSHTAGLTLQPLTMTGISVNPKTIRGSATQPFRGTVTFNGASPSSGETVALTSSDPRVLKVPSTVKLSEGRADVTFPIVHYGVNSNRAITLTATWGSQTVSVQVGVIP